MSNTFLLVHRCNITSIPPTADLFIAAKRENDGKPSKVRPLRGNGGNTGLINPEMNNQMHNASQAYNRNLQKNSQEGKIMTNKQPVNNQIG